MADQWFIARDNKKLGPFTAAKLKELAAQGRLSPTDLLLREGMQKWVAASSVKGLFPSAPARPAAVKPQPTNGGSDFQFTKAADGVKPRRTQAPSRKKLLILGAAGGSVLLLVILVVVLVAARGKRSGPPALDSAPGKVGCDISSSGGKETVKTVADIHPKFVGSIAFSPDGKLLATASRSDGKVKLWRSLSGEPILTISVPEKTASVTGKEVKDSIHQVTFSPDGKKLAFGCEHTISVWDAGTGNRLFSQSNHAGYDQSVAFSPDGTRIAIGGKSRVTIWDASTGQLVVDRKMDHKIHRVAFSPDGKMLASCQDDAITFWDAGNVEARLLTIKPRRKERFYDLAFSPDGKRIAAVQQVPGSRNANAVLSVWDAASGKETYRVSAHSYYPVVSYSCCTAGLGCYSIRCRADPA